MAAGSRFDICYIYQVLAADAVDSAVKPLLRSRAELECRPAPAEVTQYEAQPEACRDRDRARRGCQGCRPRPEATGELVRGWQHARDGVERHEAGTTPRAAQLPYQPVAPDRADGHTGKLPVAEGEPEFVGAGSGPSPGRVMASKRSRSVSRPRRSRSSSASRSTSSAPSSCSSWLSRSSKRSSQRMGERYSAASGGSEVIHRGVLPIDKIENAVVCYANPRTGINPQKTARPR